MKHRLYLAAVAWTCTVVRAALPYNPASAFLAPSHDVVYAFLPGDSTSSSATQLLSLNISTAVDGSDPIYSTITEQLPFLKSDGNAAFTPVFDDNGDLHAYAGDCGSDSSLWTLGPTAGDATQRTWTQQKSKSESGQSSTSRLGAKYLASAISFSTTTQRDERYKTYIFGGMCPTDPASEGDWPLESTYSNSMLKVSPDDSAQDAYSVGELLSKGPPIPEAGFSITPLKPSKLESSDGAGTQQQNFVMIGGHTQNAFINMSQVALFSLPEESWSFVAIAADQKEIITDLAVRDDVPDVDSRSGHTAVLTSDGKRIIVFGGWVGDLATPADPQFVVLELGDGYGGTGEWRWTAPETMAPAIDEGSGIYGHGAVMLPGNVMMVVGGSLISQASKSKAKAKAKRAGASKNQKTLFFNTTSNSWLSTYSNPLAASGPRQSADNAAEPSSSSTKKAALGSGIALGLSAIIGAILVWFWYSRRVRRRHSAREKELRNLSITAQRFGSSDMIPASFSTTTAAGGGGGGGMSSLDWLADGNYYEKQSPAYAAAQTSTTAGSNASAHASTDAERTGLLIEIPSPTRGLRKSLHSRGRSGDRLLSVQLNPPYHDDGRRSMAGSIIHPIDERDEYEHELLESAGIRNDDVNLSEHHGPVGESRGPKMDPFQDPNPLGSHPLPRQPSPSSPAREREREIQQWISGWAAADARLHGGSGTGGAVSPDRRSSPDKDRTSSNLSERSTLSVFSALQQQQSIAGSVSRSVSQRSAALFSMNPFASSNTSTTAAAAATSTPIVTSTSQPLATGQTSPTRGLFGPRFSNASTSSSRILGCRGGGVAVSSSSGNPGHEVGFPLLQTEAETLLPRPDGSSLPESPTKSSSGKQAPPPRSQGGWMGSVRRVLPSFVGNGTRSIGPPSPTSASSSPTRHSHRIEDVDDAPRRTLSAGSRSSSYWRRKQGAADWDAQRLHNSGGGNGRAGTAMSSHGTAMTDDGDEGEWDVEAAVENRVVQVMFTVPREKLRVVNAGKESEDLDEDDAQDEEGRRGVVDLREAVDQPVNVGELALSQDERRINFDDGDSKGKDIDIQD
ncbi:MAG: hypothetical protein M1825_003397 [Sarcosagium campestre]|nr:MAG: hypothetical protein M1825_003397 [Sarcosagium campestre]